MQIGKSRHRKKIQKRKVDDRHARTPCEIRRFITIRFEHVGKFFLISYGVMVEMIVSVYIK